MKGSCSTINCSGIPGLFSGKTSLNLKHSGIPIGFPVLIEQCFATIDEAIGNMTQFDLIPGDDRRHYISEVEEQFKHGNIAYLEHDIVRKDGTRVHVNCIGKRYYDSAAKAYRSEILVSRI